MAQCAVLTVSRPVFTARQHECTICLPSTFRIEVGRLCCVTKLTVWPAHFSDAAAAYAVNRALVIIYRAGYDE